MSQRITLPVQPWIRNRSLSRALLVLMSSLIGIGGCVSGKVEQGDLVATYQRGLARTGPQQRLDAEMSIEDEPLGLLKPVATADTPSPELAIAVDPNTGEQVISLTLEQAVAMTMANSPEIRVISFDPEIARQQVVGAAGEFDPVAFGRVNYEDQDSPQNSIFEPGQAETRLFESGVQQKMPLGTEWSASYALARIWDDLFGRALPTRYEPALIFELRQPLLRGAWETVNLAGVNIAKLNYEAALLAFRERAEEASSAVAVTYWRLVQAHRDLEIQRQLVQATLETLRKVEGRRDIDATDVQIKQAQAYALSRQAMQLELEKRVVDAQDVLVRLIADPQINMTRELRIVPTSNPQMPQKVPAQAAVMNAALATAMARNPVVQRAQLGVEVAEINVRVAENQKMPRLDLVASTRARGLDRNYPEANTEIRDTDYVTYAVGLTFEVPLGNRQRQAEWMRRRLEQRKAISSLQSTADRVGAAVKEAVRRVRTNLEEVEIQRQATEAARIHLATLEEAEQIRDRLTPEFLMVKLQAQETYAQSQRAAVAALVDLNVAVEELARETGTALDMRIVETALTSIVDASLDAGQPQEQEAPETKNVPLLELYAPVF